MPMLVSAGFCWGSRVVSLSVLAIRFVVVSLFSATVGPGRCACEVVARPRVSERLRARTLL